MNDSLRRKVVSLYELCASAQERKSIGRELKQWSQDGSVPALIEPTATDQS